MSVERGIGKKRMEQLRQKTHIGDRIKVYSVKYKPFDGEKACDRTPVLARVVAKTARLCVVELPNGTKESFSWAELWISKNVGRIN